MLKGGYALQLRLEHAHDVRPRTTRDVDLQTVIHRESVREALIRAARIDLGDWVQFGVSELTAPRDDEQALERGALRSQVEMLLDGRHFETFNVDVGLHDPRPQQVDILTLPPLLEFAGVLPVQVPCYPLTQHIAELGTTLFSSELRHALEMTFAQRGSALPARLPDPPMNWEKPYRELAHEAHLRQSSLGTAIDAARQFIDPVLDNQLGASWSRQQWRWIPLSTNY